MRCFVLLLAVLTGPVVHAEVARREQPGPLADGGYLLGTGWRIHAAGRNISLSTLPMSHALSPDGRMLAVLNGGYAPPSVSMLDLETGTEVSRTTVGDAWRGLAFSAAGTELYAGNGGQPYISEFAVKGGSAAFVRKINLFPGEKTGEPHLIADVVRVGRRLLVADNARDVIIPVDLPEGSIGAAIHTTRNPYAMLLDPDGQSVFVSSWFTSRVIEYRLRDGAELAAVEVGPHPTEMAWLPSAAGPRLAVACANTNRLYVLAKHGTQWVVVDRISLVMTPRQPVGTTPSALSLSANGSTLYVACSDINAVAVVDVSGPAKLSGFVPSGWYPTSLRALPDGRLVVLNGKGLRSYPNSNGLNPFRWKSKIGLEHVALIQTGSASIIDPFDENQLKQYTKAVLANSPYRDSLLDTAGVPPGNPVPDHPGLPSPIRHIVLLMQEMRTYDQVLGDLKEGNGDPSKVMFGEKFTPNQHKLSREFVLLDNFYANGDVSKDGNYWTTAAIAPDSIQRTWPMATSQHLPSAARPEAGPEGRRIAPGGQLWDKAVEAGLSFYNYGFEAVNLPNPPSHGVQIKDVADSVLKPHTSYLFRQFDFGYSDIDRVQVFIDDLKQWEIKGEMPRLILMTLGNAHTAGVSPGKRTPYSLVADNDQALGVMVEAITKSRFWADTAMFVLWNDSQDGVDHVDSHRSPGYVISPYARRNAVDSGLYNTCSMLRTIELILGLQPMTIFDAAARPMATVFQPRPNVQPYTHEPPRVPLDEKNPITQ